MSDIICRRCGLCCFLNIDGRISHKPCTHLVSVGNNRYVCRIFKQRLGKDIGNGNKCYMRETVHRNYVGCPYNKKEWGKELNFGDEL